MVMKGKTMTLTAAEAVCVAAWIAKHLAMEGGPVSPEHALVQHVHDCLQKHHSLKVCP